VGLGAKRTLTGLFMLFYANNVLFILFFRCKVKIEFL
jgi:hypothetical protein